MPRPPRVTLEQWATLKAVVEEGSFAHAAEVMNKSQSSVSYAISRLNEQLPTPALQIQGRRAVLTDSGEVLYRRAVHLLREAEEAEETARLLARGVEAEITLAIDALLESSRLTPMLESFSREFPRTRVRILETSLSGTEEALLERRADIVVGSTVPVGFLGTPLQSVRMIPVARPDHPLFEDIEAERQGINEWELRSWRQVVLRDTGQRREQDAGWLGSEQRWTVSHFSTAIGLLRSGLAFAFIPEDWIREELEEGTLRELPLAMQASRLLPLYLMMASPEAAGPATHSLASLMLTHFGRRHPE